jgi:hypothetical protein
MTKLQEATLDRLIAPTNHVVDRQSCLAALYYGRKQGIEAEAVAMIIGARRRWLNRLSVWQRDWQRQTRRPSHARHHDSIAIREKYVRVI